MSNRNEGIAFTCPECGYIQERSKCKCVVCGHEWLSIRERPLICSKCHSYQWDGREYPLRHCYRCGHEWRGRYLNKIPKCCKRCYSATWHLEIQPDRKTKIREPKIQELHILNKWGVILSPRERTILALRFGADGRALTLREIGALYSVTTERIRQIEAKALRKMGEAAQELVQRVIIG